MYNPQTMHNAQLFIEKIGFKLKDGTHNSYAKLYQTYEIKVVLDELDLKKSIVYYGKKIKVGRKTTSNLSQNENFVILECVDRLLEKGYNPESIELEKSWNLGHKGKGFLDILVKDKQGKSLFMIECKNWGDDFNKEKNKMLKDGGQLLSYYRQERSVKSLCLYASKFEDGKIQYTNELIDTSTLKGENEEEIFDSWDNTFNTKGIFEHGIKPYEFKKIGLTYEDLGDLEKSDGQTIFHQFAEILRKHIVSDKPNAFNKIFNLFICKIQDEDERFGSPNEDLFFQFKASDDSESLFDRLNTLYKKGLETYIDIILPDINEKEFNALIESKNDEKLKEQFRNLRYYRSSQEFAFKDVYNKETFEENAEVVKEVVKLLQKFKIKYSKKHQHLGDFFELLLNTGFKQESGQYFTPIPLTRFICKSLPIKEIIDRKNDDKDINFLPYVIDYASGSGHFITEIMDEIDGYVQQIGDHDIKAGRQAIKEFKRENLEWARNYIYAVEKDYRLVKISKVSSFLNGDGDANVMSVDGLAPFDNKKYKGVLYKDGERQENNEFDILVANPPYSVSGFRNPLIKEHGNIANLERHFELAKYLTDKSGEIECLFVERAKQLLKEKSVAGIILPISILTNGGIYEKTREMILEHFNIKAVVSLGNNAFMATGTKTIILFLEKRKSQFSDIKKVINKFFDDYKDVICGGVKNAFSSYVKSIYEDLDFDDYVNFLKGVKNAKLNNSEICKEYQGLSLEEIVKIEKEKLLYFINSFSQQVIVADSGEKIIEKEFYGYEFSNRRGHEGIHIYKDEEGKLISKLYNEDSLEDEQKLNSYILRSFRNDVKLQRDLEEIQASEHHPLKDHIHCVKLSQLMSFNYKKFDKSINLNKKKDFRIESKWDLIKLMDLLKETDVESGNREKGGAKTHGVMSLGGEHVGLDGNISLNNMKYVSPEFYKKANRGVLSTSDILICKDGALTGKVAIVKDGDIKGDAMINEHLFKISSSQKALNQYYLFYYLFLFEGQKQIKAGITGAAQGGLNRKNLFDIKIPLPPVEIQQRIIEKIKEIENEEKKEKQSLVEVSKKIIDLFNSGEKVKVSDVITLEYGFALPKRDRIKGKFPVVGANGIDGYHNEYMIESPAVIVGRKGSAGKVNWIDENCTPIDTTFYVKTKPEKVILKFIYYVLKFSNLEKLSSGIGTPGLKRDDAYNVQIHVPEITKQKKIIAEVEELEVKIKSSESYLKSSKDLKQSILDKYLK